MISLMTKPVPVPVILPDEPEYVRIIVGKHDNDPGVEVRVAKPNGSKWLQLGLYGDKMLTGQEVSDLYAGRLRNMFHPEDLELIKPYVLSGVINVIYLDKIDAYLVESETGAPFTSAEKS